MDNPLRILFINHVFALFQDYLPRAAVLFVRIASLVLPSAIVANSKTTPATLPSGSTAA